MARKTTAEKSYGLLRFYLLTRNLITVRTVTQQHTKTISQCTELYSVHTKNKSLEYWTRISHYRVWLHIVVLPPARRTIIQNKYINFYPYLKHVSIRACIQIISLFLQNTAFLTLKSGFIHTKLSLQTGSEKCSHAKSRLWVKGT
jgi:hypothetical protein